MSDFDVHVVSIVFTMVSHAFHDVRPSGFSCDTNCEVSFESVVSLDVSAYLLCAVTFGEN